MCLNKGRIFSYSKNYFYAYKKISGIFELTSHEPKLPKFLYKNLILNISKFIRMKKIISEFSFYTLNLNNALKCDFCIDKGLGKLFSKDIKYNGILDQKNFQILDLFY
jgi:hypothetical protein